MIPREPLDVFEQFNKAMRESSTTFPTPPNTPPLNLRSKERAGWSASLDSGKPPRSKDSVKQTHFGNSTKAGNDIESYDDSYMDVDEKPDSFDERYFARGDSSPNRRKQKQVGNSTKARNDIVDSDDSHMIVDDQSNKDVDDCDLYFLRRKQHKGFIPIDLSGWKKYTGKRPVHHYRATHGNGKFECIRTHVNGRDSRFECQAFDFITNRMCLGVYTKVRYWERHVEDYHPPLKYSDESLPPNWSKPDERKEYRESSGRKRSYHLAYFNSKTNKGKFECKENDCTKWFGSLHTLQGHVRKKHL